MVIVIKMSQINSEMLAMHFAALQACPMTEVKSIIEKSDAIASNDPVSRMQILRRIMEDMFGGKWGVLIITDTSLVSTQIHWTIPHLVTPSGVRAYCHHVYKDVQYNVFKTSNIDSADRATVESVLNSNLLIDSSFIIIHYRSPFHRISKLIYNPNSS
ncbi:unnamed protein product [Anisakis simplex]|uniref:MULE domain-containing protein n=1 Tax=Anisakis simplex TaxID=6269 RepID=A0A0M3J464_ANISI|nr:unnamed protein product [Anisakis simplex]